jgi:hypothetical protein
LDAPPFDRASSGQGTKIAEHLLFSLAGAAFGAGVFDRQLEGSSEVAVFIEALMA